MDGRGQNHDPGADHRGQHPQFREDSRAGGGGALHPPGTEAGCWEASAVSGAVWEWVPVSEMRVCVGAAAGVCEPAEVLLPGMPGTLSQYCAVYGEGGWGIGV